MARTATNNRKNLEVFLPLLLGVAVCFIVSAVTGQENSAQKIPFSFSPAKKSVSTSGASGGAPTPWQLIETRYTIVSFKSLEDLKNFNRGIDYGGSGLSLPGIFTTSRDENLAQEVMKKVDALFQRVQKILDMRKRIPKITVKVFSGKNHLQAECKRISGGDCRIRAWYIFENHTIYVNAKDVHEGILAHELAHGIIDHYFDVRPPRATAEILARYVDRHLHF